MFYTMNSYDSFSIKFQIFEATKDEEQCRKTKLFQTELLWGLFVTIISGCLKHVLKYGKSFIFQPGFQKSQKLNIHHTKLVKKSNHLANIIKLK